MVQDSFPLNAIAVMLFLVNVVFSTKAGAQYEEWYLDCTIVEKRIPDDIPSYSFLFKSVKGVKLYMPFNNRGRLGVEAVKITYITDDMSAGDLTPLSLFNTVRFSEDSNLVTGVVKWQGLEPRSYIGGWSMTGEVRRSTNLPRADYVETFFRKQLIIGRMVSSCVFNNPN
jgi:hypothetical protein